METNTAARTIATLTIVEAVDVAEMFESAAQYRTTRIPAGIYDLQVRSGARGDYCVIALFGDVVASGYGPKRYDHELGHERAVTVQIYKYAARAAIESGRVAIGRPVGAGDKRVCVFATVEGVGDFDALTADVRGV